MTRRMSIVLPLAAAVAAAAGCSHTKTPEERTREAAQHSQEAFEQAADDQKAIEEQQKRVNDAHGRVAEAQKALAEAQGREEQEQTKVRQLRERADANLAKAGQAAQQARMSAADATPRGIQTAAGSVEDASADRLVIQTPGGRALAFRIDDRTQVLVGSEARSAAEIQRGADAQVAYDAGAAAGGEPTALTVRVTPLGYDGLAPSGTGAREPDRGGSGGDR